MCPVQQTPRETLPYQAQIAQGNNDTIASAAWSITGTGTIGIPVTTLTASSVFVSNLASGQTYTLACLITGVSGAIYEGSILIQCVTRRFSPDIP